MGFVLAIAVFVYPLALPLVTVFVCAFVAMSLPRLATMAARALVALPILVALMSPGVVSGGTGWFLLPWWLHVMVGHQEVKYYPLPYTLACIAVLAVSFLAVAAYRAVVGHRARTRGHR